MKLLCAAVFLILHSAAPAYAHGSAPGMEGFYLGLLNTLSAAPQLVLLLGLGLLIGGFENRQVTWPIFSFLLGMLVGIIFGTELVQLDYALLAVALLCSAVAAALPGRYLTFAVVMAIGAGFLIGADSIPDPGPIVDRIFTVAGAFVGATVGLLYVSGAAVYVKENYARPWVSSAFRSVAALVCVIVTVLAFRLGTGV